MAEEEELFGVLIASGKWAVAVISLENDRPFLCSAADEEFHFSGVL